MRQLMDRRLVVAAGCWLLLAADLGTASCQDGLGRSTLELVSGPQSMGEADDVDAPPAYVGTSPSTLARQASRGLTATPAPSPPASLPAFRPAAAPPVVQAWSPAEPQVTNQTRQALGFYGGASARATLSEMPRRAPLVSSPALRQHQPTKPFETIVRDPTVSPYLNLYREENDSEAAPNYFAFVRPQLEQIEANRRQQRELQQLRRQVQTVSGAAVGLQYQGGGISGTGHVARFMDTAQFYGQWQR